MRVGDNVPSEMKSAVEYAVETGNRALLNRIELEVVRDKGISPDDGVTCSDGSFASDQEGEWQAAAVVDAPCGLVIAWDTSGGGCLECDGDGDVEFFGKTGDYTIVCPKCSGTGNANGEPRVIKCVTDMDGMAVDLTEEAQREVYATANYLSASDPIDDYRKMLRQRAAK